jgi:hypothetical protein
LNTDLLKHRRGYLYTKGWLDLNVNEIKWLDENLEISFGEGLLFANGS